jgi:thioredoxin reductase
VGVAVAERKMPWSIISPQPSSMSNYSCPARGISDGDDGEGHLSNDFHAVVIGSGPTGLQAAMTLGRALKHTLVIDNESPRNRIVKHFHNFLGNDGENPINFRRSCRKSIGEKYGEFVQFLDDEVVSVSGSSGAFHVVTVAGREFSAKRLLLAMGVREELPVDAPKCYQTQYYRSIFHCPYCHGIEIRNKKLAVVCSNTLEHVVMMRCWSSDIILFTNGEATPWLNDGAQQRLRDLGIRIEEGKIVDLDVAEDTCENDEIIGSSLRAIILADGRRIEREIIFQKFKTSQQKLVDDLNLKLDDAGHVEITHPNCETSVRGIYAAGDMASEFHQVAIGVGMGCEAASAIVKDLTLNESLF